MTTDELRRHICGKVSHRISEVAPRGLGRWGDAWHRVREPSDAFLDALAVFLEADTPETRTRIQRAADALVRAWRAAGQEWEARGCPRGSVSGGDGRVRDRKHIRAAAQETEER